jgi:FkbM family methyltransferase
MKENTQGVPLKLAIAITIKEHGWVGLIRAMPRYIARVTGLSRKSEATPTKSEPIIEDVLLKFMLENVKPGSVIYDCGAHIGLYAITLATKIPDCIVYAFEPNPTAHAELVRRIDAMGLGPVVKPIKAALDESCGVRTFYISSEPCRCSLNEYNAVFRDNQVTNTVDVVCYSIDQLVDTGLCEAPDVIKIDTEGNEHRVVFGARNTIASKSPTIYFEPHGINGEDIKTSQPICTFLSSLHYEIRSLGYPMWAYKE